ncbi:HAMP domain-containing histidine kinase [Clostridium perfringens]|nr:HAMP domain-containing histidine kinase [Clostridium perfringens]HAT4178452.1 HAMP domain-containing histidine kinase [Clostridium perfringens]
MGIKLTNSFSRWWKNYSLSVRSIENMFIVIFAVFIPVLYIILFGGYSFDNIAKLNSKANPDICNRVMYRDALINPHKYKECRLLAQSVDISDFLYNETNYLSKLDSLETKEQKQAFIAKLQERATSYSGVVLINKKTGEYYSNRVWFYEKPYNLSTPKEVLESLSKNDNVVFKEINSSDNYEEIYFSRGELYDSEINSIRIAFIATMTTTLLMLLLIIKKLVMIKNMGIRAYKDSWKNGYFFRFLDSLNVLITKKMFIEEFLKDKVVMFVISFTIIYILINGFMRNIEFVWKQYHYVLTDNRYLWIIPIVLVIHFIVKFIRKYDGLDTVIKGIEKVKKGDTDIEIKDNDDRQIRKLADDVNDLRLGYKELVEEGIKNEKLKTELISNVSHDLKTPLTSIINYVNILQLNNITEEERKEYIEILDKKSQTLKKLIDDLFEVSKMSSGKVELFKYNIDIIQLVYQCIAEVEDVYSEKEIEFKINGPEECMVKIDPQRMSRVFQNLITNALKYSLEKTRVYVEIKDLENYLEISFKNISSYALDFDEKDILERFARGDESRNSTIEGSGLGLAIAKTIVELHNGKFRVECEGDLFKAFVIIPKNKDDNNEEQ